MLLHLLLLALLQMNSPPCRVCGSTDLHYVGMLPGSEEDVSWGAERVEGYDCAQCRVVSAGGGTQVLHHAALDSTACSTWLWQAPHLPLADCWVFGTAGDTLPALQ